MHSDPDDRLSLTESRRKPWWGLTALAVIVVAITYFYSAEETPAPVQTPTSPPSRPTPPPAALTLPPAPDIPIPAAPAVEPAAEETVKVEEPKLASSDHELRQILSNAGDSELISSALASENLIARCAGIVDGFSRGHVPYKALPVKPPLEKFTIVTIENEKFMDPAGYHRYDRYAKAISGLNTETLVATFNRFRPLLEQAYAGLGYPAEDFDNAVIRSLDRVLATPELHEPIAVKRKETIYLFVDAQLEALTGMQKLLLRMGPENTALIKAQALALRSGLLGSEPL